MRYQPLNRFILLSGGSQTDDLYAASVAELLSAAKSGEAAPRLTELKRAEEAAPQDARLDADLAAVYLVAGELDDDLDLVLQAVETADHALELQPDRVAALFNRALALSWIPLPRQAVEAWDRLLEVEQDEAWRQEAMERRAAVLTLLDRGEEPEVVARCRKAAHGPGEPADVIGKLDGEVQHVRLYVEEELLREWGEAVEAGDEASAARRLAVAKYLVEALESARGDAVVLRLSLEAIERSRRANSGRLRALARAHRLYGEARVAHDAGEDYRVVGLSFDEAAHLFESAASPFAAWPRFYLAVEAHHQLDFPASQEALHRLRRTLPEGDRVLTAYCEWMEGLTLSKQAYYEEALRRFQRSRDLFESAGERENVSAMDSQTALKWENLGRPDEAWKSHRAALAARQDQYKSRRIQNTLSGVGGMLEHQGRSSLAILFFDEWVEEAVSSGSALSATLAWTGRASVRLALGEVEAAEIDLRRAEAALPKIADAGVRLETRIGVETTLAALDERSDPAVALAAYRNIQDELTATPLRLSFVDVLLRQARLYGRLGSPDLQESKLTDAIAEVERQRALIGDPFKRVSYLDQARHVMEEAVAFYLDTGRPEEAFLLSEQMRAPVMREEHRRRGIGGELRTLGQVQRELGEGATVLSYLLLTDRLVRWEVRRDGLEVQQERDVDRGQLRGDVGRFVASVRSASIDRGSPLGRKLLPDSLAARKNAQLLIVPDGPLHFLPFAALPLHLGESLVVDHVSVVVAPSVNVSLDLMARRKALRATGERSALVVANFEHSRKAYPQLAALVGDLEEIDRIRIPEMKITLLTGSAATRTRFLAMFGHFRDVYFGGHGITRGQYLGGALLMAPESSDDNGLLAYEDLLSVDLSTLSTQNVVLVACDTGVGELSGTEGALSIAQPFLAIGVPRVIASLTSVTSIWSPSGYLDSNAAFSTSEHEQWSRQNLLFQIYGAVDV